MLSFNNMEIFVYSPLFLSLPLSLLLPLSAIKQVKLFPLPCTVNFHNFYSIYKAIEKFVERNIPCA